MTTAVIRDQILMEIAAAEKRTMAGDQSIQSAEAIAIATRAADAASRLAGLARRESNELAMVVASMGAHIFSGVGSDDMTTDDAVRLALQLLRLAHEAVVDDENPTQP